MTVSVLIPTYNSLPYLATCLDSLKGQLNEGIEIVIVDAESTDGTREYASSRAAEFAEFRVIVAPPSGCYNAWNLAIRSSKGEALYFLPSDDFLLPGGLSTLKKALLQPTVSRPLGFASGQVNFIDDAGVLMPNAYEQSLAVRYYGDAIYQPHLRDGRRECLRHFFLNCPYISLTGSLFIREAIESVGLFSEDYSFASDRNLELQICSEYDVAWCPKKVAVWRVRESQLSRPSHLARHYREIWAINLRNRRRAHRLLAPAARPTFDHINQRYNQMLKMSFRQSARLRRRGELRGSQLVVDLPWALQDLAFRAFGKRLFEEKSLSLCREVDALYDTQQAT